MSAFYDQIDEIMGAADDIGDIVATARKCWFYDFKDDPVYLWDGQGPFIDSLGREWLGTVDNNGGSTHKTPSLQDGRDGTSASYNFSLNVPNLTLYEELMEDEAKCSGRDLTCYLVLFQPGEGMRPGTPLSFYKKLTMFAPKFDEQISVSNGGIVTKNYVVSLTAKDDNYGRAETFDRSYADKHQKRHAAQLGVSVDKGSEYLALLANRTYQVP